MQAGGLPENHIRDKKKQTATMRLVDFRQGRDAKYPLSAAIRRKEAFALTV